MIGSLFYIALDITFNVAWWVTVKGFNGLYGVANSIYYYNNDVDGEKLEEKDLKILREKVKKQDELIKELKSKIIEKNQLEKLIDIYDLSIEPCLQLTEK